MHVDDLERSSGSGKLGSKPDNAPKTEHGEKLSYLNVGTGKDISIKNLAEKIALATNFEGQIVWNRNKPDGTPKKQLDVSNFNKLGWFPKIELDEGIMKTVKDFKSEQEKQLISN